MFYHEGMGPRRSIVHELNDTIFFGDLYRIKDAGRHRKLKTEKGDCYSLPFGRSKDLFGTILVHSPSKIEIVYRDSGTNRKNLCRSVFEAKRFLVSKFVC
jgi:hypothetical protein